MSKEKKTIRIPSYSLAEELWNSISHGIGAGFGIVVLVLMIIKAVNDKMGPLAIVSVSIFGSSMIILYTMSCIYHALSKNLKGKKVLRVLDHCNVFLLVWGTYIPIALVGVGGILGWVLFSIVASVSIVGIVLSAVDVDKFTVFEVICHLVNGWSIVAGVIPLYHNCGLAAVLLILGGGLLYSLGAVLYLIGAKKKYMHSIFHFFCLGGTVLHFLAIYLYII